MPRMGATITQRFIDLHHDIAGGEDRDMQFDISPNTLDFDLHVDKLYVSLENAPGTGKTVTITCSNGTSTMTVEVTGSSLYGNTITNNFDYNRLTQHLEVTLSATGGTAAGCATIVVQYHVL